MKPSWKLLEFDKVLSRLKDRLKTEIGVQSFEELSPEMDPMLTRRELLIVGQAMDFIRIAGVLSFDYLEDLNPILSQLRVQGYVLSIEELLEIAKAIEIFANNVHHILPYSDDFSEFSALVSAASVPDTLLKRFEQVFDSDGNIKDSATPELKKVRSRKKNMKSNLQKMLNKIMDSEEIKEAIQERIVTVRDNRFVIPVKVGFKNRVGSIVHSISNSGNTAFVEPPQVVALNNEMIEIDELEKREIFQIMRDLSDQVRSQMEDILELHRLIGLLESISVRAQCAIKYRCEIPVIIDEPGRIRLVNARHPLLMDEDKVVPIDVEIGYDYEGIIISGPNAGGKTVALKTTGLLYLMAASGIPIPARSQSEIGRFDEVLTEIGDEQSITDHLSSFSGHITQLAKILRSVTENSIVLIDEIASSTEPKEGEAIGREIILELIRKKARFMITTHFQGIKNIATEFSSVRNAYVEFDPDKLEPLYRLHVGAAGKSYALSIAGRYGLSQSIIEQAGQYLQSQMTRNERLIDEIEDEKNRLNLEKERINHELAEAETLKRQYRNSISEFEVYKKELEKTGISELKRELDSALEEISQLKKQLKTDKKEALKTADEITEKTREVIERTETEILERERKHPENIFPGQKVYIRSFDKTGTVEDINDHKIKVRIGIISSVVDKDDLYIDEDDEQTAKKASYTFSQAGNSSNYEYVINLIGERTEDAIKRLDKNLEIAVIQGQHEMIVVHGKGKGILRSMIRDYLKKHPQVENFYHAKPHEGGEGKTIIELK